MTTSLSKVAFASQRLADAIGIVPDLRIVTTVAMPITAPAVVIGPPRLVWAGYNQSGFTGQPVTAQWNVYYVVTMNQYAIDVLLASVAAIAEAIERYTPGVVIGAGPGLYPSPNGPLPSYTIVVQMEVGMA